MNQMPLHGGDLVSAQAHAPGPLLDVSVNLNPLGMPPSVAQAAREAIGAADTYPDPHCRALRQAIGEMDGVPDTAVVCGNGAAELLFRLALTLRPRRAMVTAPTFGEYERALAAVGCRVCHHYLKEERQFDLPEGFLRTLRPDLDLLVLCNPNNPTGRLIDPGMLHAVLEYCEAHGIWLLLDESFWLFTDRAAQPDLAPLLMDHLHLLLLRSMTKAWAMPGLRLGYVLSGNRTLVQQLAQCGQPWSVSGPAQRAGVAACRCRTWTEAGRVLVATQRPRLQQGLGELGFQVVESAANYVLFRAPGNGQLQAQMLRQGVLLRSCANFRGLGPDWYRVAVGDQAQNARLLQALSEG